MANLGQINLNNISQIELENLRHIIDEHKTMASKLSEYSNRCQDPQLKQMLQQSAQSAQTTVQQLTNKL